MTLPYSSYVDCHRKFLGPLDSGYKKSHFSNISAGGTPFWMLLAVDDVTHYDGSSCLSTSLALESSRRPAA